MILTNLKFTFAKSSSILKLTSKQNFVYFYQKPECKSILKQRHYSTKTENESEKKVFKSIIESSYQRDDQQVSTHVSTGKKGSNRLIHSNHFFN